jgi:hypothetical protein
MIAGSVKVRGAETFPAPLSDADIDAATHIVGMMGVEPIQEALRSGAQILMKGVDGSAEAR